MPSTAPRATPFPERMAKYKAQARGRKKWRLNLPRFLFFLAIVLAVAFVVFYFIRAADPAYEWPAALRFIQRPTFGQNAGK